VAGDGSQRAALEQLSCELGLRYVTFLGAVGLDQIPGVYDQGDIFLNASNIDNMPVSILEAFASGLPVVTTDAGGIPFLVEHRVTGLLVPREDHDALAAAALELLANPPLALSIAAKARAKCDKYALEAVVQAWLVTYGELLGRPAAPSRRPPVAASA